LHAQAPFLAFVASAFDRIPGCGWAEGRPAARPLGWHGSKASHVDDGERSRCRCSTGWAWQRRAQYGAARRRPRHPSAQRRSRGDTPRRGSQPRRSFTRPCRAVRPVQEGQPRQRCCWPLRSSGSSC
jgi:hypothetical protein